MLKNPLFNTAGIIILVGFLGIFFQNCAAGGGSSGSGGGGGSTSTVAGKAVAGAPIIGTVTIKDSSVPPKTKFTTIEADGNYSVDVSGLTPPFMLRADGTVGGRSYSIYSAATSADLNGTINVTPLTDLILANIAGQLASTYFSAGHFSNLTTSQLNSASAALEARLLPILTAVGVSGSIDLLRVSFAADHTGIDAALDVIRVDTDPNTGISTIKNIISNTQITNDPTNVATTTIDATGVAAGLTDYQAALQLFTTFGNLFATSLPSVSDTTLVGLFDSSFLSDGSNKAQFLSQITSDPNMVGLKFSNVSIVPGSVASGTLSVSFTPIQGGQAQDNMTFDLVKSSGLWHFVGNGRAAEVQARTFARLQDVYTTSSTPVVNYIDTGLIFGIKAHSSGANYAIVSGKGLPAHTAASHTGGALYFNKNNGSFDVAPLAGWVYNGTNTASINAYGNGQIPLGDSDIGSIGDNEIYTIELWSDNGTVGNMADDTLITTYTEVLPKRPYLSTELSISSFAPILSLDRHALFNYGSTGGTFPVSWTIPSGLHTRELSYFRSGNGSGTSFNDLEIQLAGTVTSSSITGMAAIDTSPTAFGALVASGLNIFMADSFGRELITIRNGTYVGGPFDGL